MLELTLTKPTHPARLVAAWQPVHRLQERLRRLWRAAVRHAERPGRFVPYC